MLGLDYTARIDPAALKQAGVVVVFRYTTWSGWPKSLTPAEADELHAAGIAVAANFESTADRMRGAGPAGHADAIEARGHLGEDHLPTDLKIWFSADWDVSPGEVVLVLDYLHAAADALGGKQYVGLYGGYRAVSAAADAGFTIWQTSAWSYGRWDPRCAAKQDGGQAVVGGVQVDLNTIINLPALGAWLPGGGTTMGTIPSSITSQDPDLPELGGMFPAGQSFDPNTAAIWTDERAAAANIHARKALDAISALSQKVAADDADAVAHFQQVSDSLSALTGLVQQLGTELSSVQAGAVNVPALASALATELGGRLTLTVGVK